MWAVDYLALLCARAARVVAVTVALLVLAATASAQTEDTGVWIGVNMTARVPSASNNPGPWRVWTDGQLRFGDDASKFSQGIVRPGIGYAVGRGWTFWTGYAYIRTEPPYSSRTTTEHRIWEQVSWSGAIARTALSSRSRLEQRFVSTGSDTGWRLRELVKVTQPLGSTSMWSAVVYDEFFVNLNSTDYGASAGSDRNRFFVGPGIKLSKMMVAEIGYLNQYTFSSTGNTRNDQLFSASLFVNF